MDELRIELLYCQYGWPVEKIAQAIGKQSSYVQLVIQENGWEQTVGGKSKQLVPVNDRGEDDQEKALQELKKQELVKQTVLAPLAAITEINLMAKLAETVESVDPADLDAHVRLPNLVKAYKMLVQDSLVSQMQDHQNQPAGVAVQVITQIT